MTHSEHFLALDVLRAAYNHGHPDDLAKCEAAFDTLDGLIEQLETLRIAAQAHANLGLRPTNGTLWALEDALRGSSSEPRFTTPEYETVSELAKRTEGAVEIEFLPGALPPGDAAFNPAIIPAEASERGRNPAVDPRDAIKPESGKPRSETSASSPASEPKP